MLSGKERFIPAHLRGYEGKKYLFQATQDLLQLIFGQNSSLLLGFGISHAPLDVHLRQSLINSNGSAEHLHDGICAPHKPSCHHFVPLQ